MKTFKCVPVDSPLPKQEVDGLEEMYDYFRKVGIFPKQVVITCNFCGDRIATGPWASLTDPEAKGLDDREWAESHDHPVRKWFRRNFLIGRRDA